MISSVAEQGTDCDTAKKPHPCRYCCEFGRSSCSFAAFAAPAALRRNLDSVTDSLCRHSISRVTAAAVTRDMECRQRLSVTLSRLRRRAAGAANAAKEQLERPNSQQYRQGCGFLAVSQSVPCSATEEIIACWWSICPQGAQMHAPPTSAQRGALAFKDSASPPACHPRISQEAGF